MNTFTETILWICLIISYHPSHQRSGCYTFPRLFFFSLLRLQRNVIMNTVCPSEPNCIWQQITVLETTVYKAIQISDYYRRQKHLKMLFLLFLSFMPKVQTRWYLAELTMTSCPEKKEGILSNSRCWSLSCFFKLNSTLILNLSSNRLGW